MSTAVSVAFSAGPSEVTAHHHNFHQILFVTGGTARLTVSGREYALAADTLVLISRFEPHAVEGESDDYRRYVLEIPPDTAGDPLLLSVLTNRPAQFCHAVDLTGRAEEMRAIFPRMAAEYAADRPRREAMLGLMFQEFLVTLWRTCQELYPVLRQEEIALVEQIKARFEADCRGPYTLAGLAADCRYSPSHLSHLFRRVSGRSVMGYLLDCRIAAAKALLTAGDADVGEVAAQCGFDDHSNFSRAFRAAVGCSPSEFRKRF